MISRRAFVGRAVRMSAVPLGAANLAGCATRQSPSALERSEAPPQPELAGVEAPAIEPVSPVLPRILPSPDFASARVMRCISGVRPYRAGGIRIELEDAGVKRIVHNYGHGGAGITLAWGSAERAASLVESVERPPARVAVIGGGVIGLTMAYELLERGYAVSIHAESFPPETTSNVAGGQWSPSGVSTRGSSFGDLCRRSFLRFESMLGEEFGIFRRTNYIAGGGGTGFRRLPRGVLPPPRELDRLPFEGPSRSGLAYETLLIEPGRFLDRLMVELRERCEEVSIQSFDSLDELNDVPARVIVNCTGFGARDLTGDSQLRPIKGHLVLLEPQELPYLLSHRGYVFPRSDAVVLGGTYEEGRADLEVDDRACQRIVRINRRFFES